MNKLNKRDKKAIQDFIELKLDSIAKAQCQAIEAGGEPIAMYIGDIFPRKQDELRPSAMNECVGSIFGMKIIADFRIPKNTFYITYGELDYGRSKKS